MARIKDDLSAFHDNGIYIPKRIIELIGEIDLDTFQQVYRNLICLDSPGKEIVLIINSPGGDVTQGMAIYQAIKDCESPIVGVVYGEASSAASFILQACDERIMTEHSYMMIHAGEEGMGMMHPSNVDSLYKKLRLDQAAMENIYLESIQKKHPDYTLKKLKSLMSYDTYLSPEKALELGLIDKIKED